MQKVFLWNGFFYWRARLAGVFPDFGCFCRGDHAFTRRDESDIVTIGILDFLLNPNSLEF